MSRFVPLETVPVDGTWELLVEGEDGQPSWFRLTPKHHLAAVATDSSVYVIARPAGDGSDDEFELTDSERWHPFHVAVCEVLADGGPVEDEYDAATQVLDRLRAMGVQLPEPELEDGDEAPLWRCPWYQFQRFGAPRGTCSFGCVDEPSCNTCTPGPAGWPGERRTYEAELERALLAEDPDAIRAAACAAIVEAEAIELRARRTRVLAKHPQLAGTFEPPQHQGDSDE